MKLSRVAIYYVKAKLKLYNWKVEYKWVRLKSYYNLLNTNCLGNGDVDFLSSTKTLVKLTYNYYPFDSVIYIIYLLVMKTLN